MARPESEPKTPLAARLRDVRRSLGGLDREELARAVGVSKTTIASYERGDSEPTASVLAAYKSKYGVSVNWVIIGEGQMFDDPSMAPAESLDAELLEKIARIVTAVHRDAGIKIAAEKVSVEAAQLYNNLMSRVSDPSDAAEIEAILPQLRHLLKKRLADAAANPGTRKRSA